MRRFLASLDMCRISREAIITAQEIAPGRGDNIFQGEAWIIR
jgi:hypothetical protein